MNAKRVMPIACAAILALTLWPTEGAAQVRGRGRPHRGTRVVVGVGVGYGPGFYAPFYNPFYFGGGLGWYGGYPWYPYAYAPYPYYGYPYGYSGWPSARIEVKPRSAQVFLDGYFVGIVDQFDGVFQRLDVPPGAHELAIYLEGYRTYREKVMFRPGAGYHIKAVLEPLPAGAPPEPKPEPAPGTQGRDPYEPRARGPYRQPAAPPPGEEGRTVPLPERQRPPRESGAPQATDFGTLALRVQPEDAIVTIDGERWDSPSGGSRLVVQLAGGQHRVEVRKDGFRAYSTSVEIRPGETQTLNVSLPPM